MSELADLVAAALAIGAVVEVWFAGSIFERPRKWAHRMSQHGNVLGELLCCPFCLSYQVAVWGTIAAVLLTTATLTVPARIAMYGLAAVRLSVLINGLLPEILSYPPIEADDDE